MKGIEKITARIEADAASEVSAIRADSDQIVAQIRAEYDKKAQEAHDSIVREGEKENAQRASRIERNAQLEAKRAVLAMKQEMVSQAFSIAEKKLAQMPEADYVAFWRVKLCRRSLPVRRKSFSMPKIRRNAAHNCWKRRTKRWETGAR